MKDLLGNNADDNGEVLKMWQEGMQEYACPLGRITYEDFRMILKGQGREGEQTSSRRRSSYKKIMELSPLQAVPEGTMSPQAKHSVFAKFEAAALDSLKMPTLGGDQEGEKKKQDANIHYPEDVPDDVPLSYQRTRSGSLGYYTPAPIIWHDSDEIMPNPLPEKMGTGSPMPRRSSRVVLRNRVIGGHEFPGPQMASDSSQEAFRKHHELQKSVLEASKKFEQKVMARKIEIAATEFSQIQGTQGTRRASLVMRRGSAKMRAEVDQIVWGQFKSDQSGNAGPIQPASDSQDTSEKQVADASKRSGRPRRERRRRTNSDISGMLR
jgi:hypothetical protein